MKVSKFVLATGVLAGTISAIMLGTARAYDPLTDDRQIEKAADPFLIEHKSKHDFSTTLSKVQKAIDERKFNTFAVIDHAKGAASIGEKLRPTTLVIFGNPKGGTPLLQSAQSLGADLPLKALVYETADGDTIVAVSDIRALLSAHSANDVAERGAAIAKALESIVAAATD